MGNITITKSDYMYFLRHPAWLWLRKFQKHKLPPIDENTQDLFDSGHEFESYAEQLFPNATRLGFSNFEEYYNLTQTTLLALEKGAETILQGRFDADDLTCIIDVLDKVEDDTFDLIEIKSSTRSKPEHEYDLAFQTLVLEESGINIRNIAIIHVNNKYVRKGNIEPAKITARVDVTNSVRELMDVTKEQIEKAKEILTQKVMPDPSPRFCNQIGVSGTRWFHDWLDVYKHLNPDLDPYSIYYLSYPNEKQIGELEDTGIEFIKDVPEELALRDKQKLQIICTRYDKRIIDKEKIQEFLDMFEYPLYFFDYETLSAVVPTFDGFQPYKDYPFQYSLHVLDMPDGEVRHEEYIHQEPTNPMPDLLSKLSKDIGDSGTILAWNMGYEKGCNNLMAKLNPEYKEFLEDLNERMKDLMTPFSETWFVDKDFFGSASIKNVLPVLAPDLSYKDMEVSDGLKARRMWMQTVLEGKNDNERDKIMDDLSKYCTLDTYAMVEILNKLIETTND